MSELNNTDMKDFPQGENFLTVMKWVSEQMPGGFFVYRADDTQEILYVNKAVLKIFGCHTLDEFKEHTGYTFKGMVHPSDFEQIQSSIDDQIADIRNENMDCVEYRITRLDGKVRWIEDYGHYAELPGFGKVYYVFISDITEKKYMEETELRFEKERHSNEIKSRFLFNVSHDIRTPMNAIMGFSRLAKRHVTEPETAKEYIEQVEESGRQLLSLIDDLLDMSSLEYGRVVLKEDACNLNEQIDMVMDLFNVQAREKGVFLGKEINLPYEEVLVDAARFRRILSNLVSNAVKFTPEGGSVRITAHTKKESDSGYARYEISVSDTGIGMSDEFKERLFEAFEREQSSTEAGTTGSGLGLAIAKSLTDMMGGTLSVQSSRESGTNVTLNIPLKRVGGGTAAPNTIPAPGNDDTYSDGGKYRILLVEDIELNRMLAETVLGEAGFNVESVTDGCDAVDAIKNKPENYYDLVLMDIQMPVMNGYEATRAIRALRRADVKNLPIIALSANAREEDKRMSYESGMNAHVAKPFEVGSLISTIRGYVE